MDTDQRKLSLLAYTEEQLKVTDDCLPIDKFELWLDIIETDNVEWGKEILSNASNSGKQLLMNGKFEFSDWLVKNLPNRQKHPCVLKSPLLIAVWAASPGIVSLFLEHKVNVDISNKEYGNILHILVMGCHFNTEREAKTQEILTLIQKVILQENIERLYMNENKKGKEKNI